MERITVIHLLLLLYLYLSNCTHKKKGGYKDNDNENSNESNPKKEIRDKRHTVHRQQDDQRQKKQIRTQTQPGHNPYIQKTQKEARSNPSLLTTSHPSFKPILFLRNNRCRLRLSRGRKLAPGSDPGPVAPKDDGDGHEDEGDAAEEGAGPVDAQGVEHVRREEGEDGAEEGAQEGVCGYGGGGAGKKKERRIG